MHSSASFRHQKSWWVRKKIPTVYGIQNYRAPAPSYTRPTKRYLNTWQVKYFKMNLFLMNVIPIVQLTNVKRCFHLISLFFITVRWKERKLFWMEILKEMHLDCKNSVTPQKWTIEVVVTCLSAFPWKNAYIKNKFWEILISSPWILKLRKYGAQLSRITQYMLIPIFRIPIDPARKLPKNKTLVCHLTVH